MGRFRSAISTNVFPSNQFLKFGADRFFEYIVPGPLKSTGYAARRPLPVGTREADSGVWSCRRGERRLLHLRRRCGDRGGRRPRLGLTLDALLQHGHVLLGQIVDGTIHLITVLEIQITL